MSHAKTPTLLLIAVAAFCADIVAWGPASGGLWLGVACPQESGEPTLRVLLENTNPTPLEVLIGHATGKGVMYDIRFFARSRQGVEREGFELNTFTPIAGLILPEVVRIEAGKTFELLIPLKRIITIEKETDPSFETLMKLGYTVHVSLETTAKTAEWAASTKPWIGKATSAGVMLR